MRDRHFTKQSSSAFFMSMIQKIPGRLSSTVALSWCFWFQPTVWSSKTGQRLCLQLPSSSLSCPEYGSCRVQGPSLCMCVSLDVLCVFVATFIYICFTSSLWAETSRLYPDWQKIPSSFSSSLFKWHRWIITGTKHGPIRPLAIVFLISLTMHSYFFGSVVLGAKWECHQI